MDDEVKKKNVLDLQFQKYLTLASTSIIIMFTYLVGIAILTKQVNLKDFIVMGILFIISVGILGICSTLFFKAIFHLKNIPEVLKEI